MKKHLLRKLALLLLLALLMSVCAAADDAPSFSGRTLEGIVAEFRQQYHLNEYNFALSYYNTVTGEQYHFNETKMMIAASTYKLPLNLYYYRMVHRGEIAPDEYIPGAGTTLDQANRRSLVNSDNDVSEAMLYHLGTFRQYKEKMRDFFTMTDDEIAPEYYTGNFYCTRMMCDALGYLYDHSSDYAEMLDYMQQANPDSYFRRLVTEYPVAHKYGSYEGSENDVGIIYTSQPFLLAVYTQNAGGEEVCAQAARLLTDYNVFTADLYEKEQQAEAERAALEAQQQAEAEEAARLRAEEQAAAAAIAEEGPLPPQEPETSDEDYLRGTGQGMVWWMLPVAAVVLLLGGGILAILFRKPGKYEKKYKKRYAKFLEEEKEPAEK